MKPKYNSASRFYKGDEVSWFEGRYSVIKNYGIVVRTSGSTAIVSETDTGKEVRVDTRNLNYA